MISFGQTHFETLGLIPFQKGLECSLIKNCPCMSPSNTFEAIHPHPLSRQAIIWLVRSGLEEVAFFHPFRETKLSIYRHELIYSDEDELYLIRDSILRQFVGVAKKGFVTDGFYAAHLH